MADSDVKDAAIQGGIQGAATGNPYAALGGAALGAVGSLMGSSAAKKAAKAAAAAARRNAAIWAAVKIPTIEEQKIILQNPQLMGEYTPEQLQYMGDMTSSMEGVAANEATVAAQNEALQGISEVAKGGFTEGDQAAQREAQRNVSQDAQARQKSILNAMASRGTLGSGMELAAELQGNQMANNQMANSTDKLIQEAQNRSLQALGQQGALAGTMRGQEVAEKTNIARAKDEIAQFNARNRQATNEANVNARNEAQLKNLAARQAMEENRANTANKQQQSDVDVIRQNFQDRVLKAKGQMGINSDLGNALSAGYNQQSDAQKNMASSILNSGINAYNASKPTVQKAEGGPVVGPGTGTSDSIPARLSNGEFVVKADVVKKPGVLDFLHNLNNDQSPVHKYAQGGLVTDEPTPEDIANFGVPEEETPAPTPEAPMQLDPRYVQAMNEQSKARAQAGLLNSILSGIEGGGGRQYKVDRSAVDVLKQSAEDPMAKYKQLVSQETAAKAEKKAAAKESRDIESHKMNMDKSKLDLDKSGIELDKLKRDQDIQKALDDGNSYESNVYRERANLKLKQIGMNTVIPKGVSATRIGNMLPYLKEDLDAKAKADAAKADNDYRNRALTETINSREQVAKLAADAKVEAAKEKKSETASAGQKEVDKSFAKEYNDWTSGGQASYDKNLNRLNEVKNTLEERKNDLIGTSGRMTGRLPDFLRSEESIHLRDTVHAAVMASLRATLGPQFTEDEGKRILSLAYNEKASPAENINKINTAIKELEITKKNKNDKTAYFESHNNSLSGYTSPKSQDTSEYVTLQSPTGEVAKVKKSEAQKYLDKGAKLVE